MRPLASRSIFDRDLPIFALLTFALFVMNDTIISVGTDKPTSFQRFRFSGFR
jgi:hypothetical protein